MHSLATHPQGHRPRRAHALCSRKDRGTQRRRVQGEQLDTGRTANTVRPTSQDEIEATERSGVVDELREKQVLRSKKSQPFVVLTQPGYIKAPSARRRRMRSPRCPQNSQVQRSRGRLPPSPGQPARSTGQPLQRRRRTWEPRTCHPRARRRPAARMQQTHHPPPASARVSAAWGDTLLRRTSSFASSGSR